MMADSCKPINSIQQIDTIYSADCTEWCHIDGFHDVLLCGTYQVNKEEGVSLAG